MKKAELESKPPIQTVRASGSTRAIRYKAILGLIIRVNSTYNLLRGNLGERGRAFTR